MVAEDNKSDRALLAKAFKDSSIPHKLTAVTNGEELMALLKNRGENELQNNEPDFLILDINMPEVNGFEVLKLIKADKKLRNIPVFILSVSSDTTDIENALKLGANGYYQKSAEYKHLASTVREICAGATRM